MAQSKNTEGKFKPSDYAYWYRLAEEVFGTLIPHLNDEEIAQLTPKKANWFAILFLWRMKLKMLQIDQPSYRL